MRKYRDVDCLAFNSYNENFVLSNMYPCTLIYNGITFCGVDHLFHYLLFDGFKEVQGKLLKCNGVNGNFQAKKIGEKFESLLGKIDVKLKYDLLYKCLKIKCEQCELFRKKLIDSIGLFLVEFAWWGDKEFGCVLENGCFIGKNACGRLMMKVRAELILEKMEKDEV